MKKQSNIPKVDPREENPNPWVEHRVSPFWRMSMPVEVQYEDGKRKILRNPPLWKKEVNIDYWRVHQELEKMEYLMKWEWHRKLTWKDRVKILFGANLLFLVGVAMRNNVGSFQPVMIGYTTYHKTADDHMEEQRKLAMAKHLKQGAKQIAP